MIIEESGFGWVVVGAGLAPAFDEVTIDEDEKGRRKAYPYKVVNFDVHSFIPVPEGFLYGRFAKRPYGVRS